MKYKQRLVDQLEARVDLAQSAFEKSAAKYELNPCDQTYLQRAYDEGKLQAYRETLQLALGLTDDGGANG